MLVAPSCLTERRHTVANILKQVEGRVITKGVQA